MRAEQTLHLLVMDDSSNAAETVSNMLRNAGHAIRTDRIEDDEDLREALAKYDCDMILAKPKLPYFSAMDALGVLEQLKRNLPLLIIADGASEENLNALLQAGARDTVEIANPIRLKHVLIREADDWHTRRRLARCEASLEEANIRAQNLVDSSRDAITYIHDGMHIFANDSYLEMFGYSDMKEIEGLPILNMVKTDEHSRFKQYLRDFSLGKTDSNSIDVNGLRPDGTDFDITMEFTPASFEGEPCTQIIIRAQVDNTELERKLDDMSKQDLLTGAYNRQFFLDALNNVVGKAGKEGAILFLKPDNYKGIRDELGIAPSDQVLVEIANIVKARLSNENDVVARFDGEYFTVLLHDLTQKQVESFGESLCSKLEETIFDVGGTTATTTCSIGIALYNDAMGNQQEVISRAEKALQEALELGGNQVKTHVPGAEEMAEKEREGILLKQIKLALRDNKMQLMFQPIASLKGDENEHYEVLLRMLNEQGEPILPKDFLPAAEKGGVMTAVDRWVMAHGIKAATQKRRQGKPVILFVKLSGASLKDQKLLPWLRDILKAVKAEPNSLVIEVSESVASSNLKALKVLIDGLSQLHVSLAIDHFGIAPNYTNLLKHCNAKYLKVDSSLIGALSSDQQARDKVQEITSLATEENKLVVANGVEDPHTLASIYSTGIDFIQGYFLQEPGPSMDFDFSSM